MAGAARRRAEPGGNDLARRTLVSNKTDSMFMYGSLVVNAPFYCGLIQGIQKTDRSGSTGTWS